MPESSLGRYRGAQPSAEEVCRGLQLEGRLAVVTGGATGLGKETARVLALAGAHVFLGGRDEQALMIAKRDISAACPEAQVSVHRLDLMSAANVSSFAAAVESLGRAVDILICNAGIMACPLHRGAAGIEAQLMTNYVGHALLTSHLHRLLRASGCARVVSLSSAAHHLASVDLQDLSYQRKPYDRWQAYGQSKTAAALLAVQVQRRLGRDGVTALAVHPGIIPTGLGRYMSEEEKAALAARCASAASPFQPKSVATGAATGVWAATAAELEGAGPAYLENCAVAARITRPNLAHGVMPYALDESLAERLWRATEQALGSRLPL
jgi:NAD(P)-dependent dehydrogenase (short-subunit alcohol dehydrogenase family)